MSKNSLVYFILFNLIQFLLIEINCQLLRIRSLHTATFIDNKLYILGGSPKTVGKQLFYLDFSGPFNTQGLVWQDLSSTNIVPSHSDATAVKGGVNNSTLFLYGANSTTNNEIALVYTYDPRSSSWSVPKISGDDTIRKIRLTGIIDSNGKMYLWGGFQSGKHVNDMLILDTINLSWRKGSLIGAPTPRVFYGATLLFNNNIIYIGGSDGVNVLTLNEVYIYDTINDNWNVKKTMGIIPSNRARFSAVLGLDGQRIIIFGGYLGTTITVENVIKPEDALYVLDLTNYSWYIPNVSGKIPADRRLHKANVIGKYMVISFGSGYNQSTESDILLLDISNNEQYIWTSQFQLTNNKTPSSSPMPSSSSSPLPPSSLPSSDNSSNNTPAIIGAIIGSLVGGSLLTLGISFLYKWNKNKQKQKNAIPIPGNVI